MAPKLAGTAPRKRSFSEHSAGTSQQAPENESRQEADASKLAQLYSLEERKGQLTADLQKVEGQVGVAEQIKLPHCRGARGDQTCACQQIFELESRYLDSCNPQGNALKGVLLLICTDSAGI